MRDQKPAAKTFRRFGVDIEWARRHLGARCLYCRHELTEISRACLAFSAMAADKNWMSVPVESNRAPMAINSAASSGRVARPPTPTCLPYLRQAVIVFA